MDEVSVSKIDVEMVLFVVGGGVLQLLSGNKVDKGELLWRRGLLVATQLKDECNVLLYSRATFLIKIIIFRPSPL